MRFVSTVHAGILCAVVVGSAGCGGGNPGAPTPPSTPAPSPTSSPSPAPAPPGTFTIACGTSPIDLGWSGVDTRSCTVTSTNGFDGDVALSCSGVDAASCEFDPTTVRAAPDRPANSTMKLTYGEGMSFGIFDAMVRGEGATAGSATASTRVNVQRDGNSLTRHCPSASDVAAIDAATILDFRHDPTAGKFVCLASEGSRDLSYFRATVYKGLTMMRRLTFSAPLPWTSGSLWPWFTSSVRGIRFLDQNTGSCCGSDRMISFPTISAAAHPEQVIFTRLTDLIGFMSLAIHEARHATGRHPHCEGGKDQSIAFMGAIGVLAVARSLCNTRFCEPQTCSF